MRDRPRQAAALRTRSMMAPSTRYILLCPLWVTLSACSEDPPPALKAQVTVPIAPIRTLKTPIPQMAVRAAGPQTGERLFGAADIEGSLEGAMIRIAGSEQGPRLSQVVKRVLVWWMNLRRDLRKGDRIEVVYELQAGDAEPIAHAIWFTSSKLGGLRTAVRFRTSGDTFARWYDAEGAEVAKRLAAPPIRDYEQITSLLKDGRRHKGVDFKAPVGTPIIAPFNGVVARRNWSRRRNGNCLELINSKNGNNAYFLHLDSIPKHIQPGRRVKVGDVVASSGNTGRSTAPHLHYQLERKGRVLDPFRVQKTQRRRLSPENQQAAKTALARYETLRAGPN